MWPKINNRDSMCVRQRERQREEKRNRQIGILCDIYQKRQKISKQNTENEIKIGRDGKIQSWREKIGYA